MVSAQELEGVSPASASRRNQSALAINGRNSSWSKIRMTTNMAPIAQPMAPRLRCSIARAT
jgi:hypothetical protein